MADIIPLDRPLAEEVPKPRRLRTLSRGLALMFGGILLLYALLALTLVAIGLLLPDNVVMGAKGTAIAFGTQPLYPCAVPASDLPLITRLTGAFVLLAEMAPTFFILWHLRGLFGLYAAGTVFARENSAHLRRIGL